MAFYFSPAQFENRSEFYHQLAQLTAAGVDIMRTLEQLRRSPPTRSYRKPIETIIENINAGSTFGESLRACGKWLPEFDLAMIDAGERSGKLDGSFTLLAQYYSERASLIREVISGLVYPVFLFHFAIFTLNFPSLFLTGDVMVFLRNVLIVLGPIYLICILGLILGQSRHGERWQAFLEIVFRYVPILGPARQRLAIARLSAALHALLSAGVNVIEAWELAAAASGSPAIRRTVSGWIPKLRSGSTPAELVQSSRAFPHLFASEYAAGEVSGRLDECLSRMHNYYQTEGSRRLRAFCQWVPRIIYIIIVVYIAYRILSFYMGYFGQLQQVLE